jgi:hypothetical protein
MMMTMASQRARGAGHCAFYLHPEAQVGSGTGSTVDATKETPPRTPAEDDTAGKTPPASDAPNADSQSTSNKTA